MSSNINDYPRFREIERLVLHLWDKAVDTPSYDRDTWQQLRANIEELARRGLGLPAGFFIDEATPLDNRMVVVLMSDDNEHWQEVGKFVSGVGMPPILSLKQVALEVVGGKKFIKFSIEPTTGGRRR